MFVFSTNTQRRLICCEKISSVSRLRQQFNYRQCIRTHCRTSTLITVLPPNVSNPWETMVITHPHLKYALDLCNRTAFPNALYIRTFTSSMLQIIQIMRLLWLTQVCRPELTKLLNVWTFRLVKKVHNNSSVRKLVKQCGFWRCQANIVLTGTSS